MAMYKLVRRAHPTDKGKPAKWYATPKSNKSLSEKELAKQATRYTSLTAGEMEYALSLYANLIISELEAGRTVRLPGVGTFRLSFKSDGVEDIDTFKSDRMIKQKRLVFAPSREFNRALSDSITFRNAGVLEDDINYDSLASYRKHKKQTEKK